MHGRYAPIVPLVLLSSPVPAVSSCRFHDSFRLCWLCARAFATPVAFVPFVPVVPLASPVALVPHALVSFVSLVLVS